MAKGKKQRRRNGGADPLVLEGDAFPNAITVELWRRVAKGKRELVDTRRYDLVAESTDSSAPPAPAAVSASAPPKPRAKAPTRRAVRGARTRTKKPSTKPSTTSSP